MKKEQRSMSETYLNREYTEELRSWNEKCWKPFKPSRKPMHLTVTEGEVSWNLFLVGAFINKRARLLQSLVFLVGAFIDKRARLLQSLVFFSRRFY